MAAAITRVIITFAVLAGGMFFALTQPANLGLDLRGGVQIVLEAKDPDNPEEGADAESTDRAISVLSNRVDALGVAEPSLSRSGENRIIVELPGLDDPNEAAEVVGQTAQLTFHPVLGYADPPNGGGNGQAGDDNGAQADENDAEGDAGNGDENGAEENGTTENGDSGENGGDNAEQDGQDDAQSMSGTGTTVQPAALRAEQDTQDDGDSQNDQEGENGAEQDQTGEGELVLPTEDETEWLRLAPARLTGEGVNDSAGQIQQDSLQWVVTIDFDGDGGRTWQELTGEAACYPMNDPQRRVAIVLDDQIISSPSVNQGVPCDVGITGGSTEITGNFDQESAQNLAALIEGGALPVPVESIEQRVVGPTLGAAAIDASIKAGLVGLALTAVFILLIYRLMGVLATIALACYALIAYSALVMIGATLTLPGLAGFVLAIGMAIDANVLIFERAREEYSQRTKAGLRPALVRGFRGAWSAIVDSNVTTLLAAGLLFFLASGPVRGFGVTLSLGVLASMFSALVIARMLTEFAAGRRFLNNHPGLSGIGSLGRLRTWLQERNPNLMQYSRRWLIISAVIVAVAISGILIRGLNFGVEFTGGRVIEYSTAQDVDVEEARQAVSQAGFPQAVVQESGSGDVSNIAVRTSELSNEEERQVTAALREVAGDVTIENDEMIGPSLGEELRTKAAIALLIALVAQMGYIAIRFRWTFGTATIAAMFHDLIAVIGLFAWLGLPIDGVFLAAALSVIGLSVNDKIVVSDRIRELWAADPKRPFRESCNLAILQTLPRTVNTTVSTLLIIGTLAVFGGDSLRTFAVALLVGLSIGVLSSMFTATPLTAELHERAKPVAPPSAGRTDKQSGKQRAQQAGTGAVV